MTNQTQILALIKQLAVGNSDIDVVWLYGSRAQGTDVEGSDFDLAIAFKDFDLSPTNAMLRPNELAMDWALALGISENILSIVDINRCPVYLAFNVVEFGQVVFETSATRVYKEHNRIYSQYEFQMIEMKQNGLALYLVEADKLHINIHGDHLITSMEIIQ